VGAQDTSFHPGGITTVQRNLISLVLAAAALSSCGTLATLGIKQSGGLEQVDKLLSHVERVQVESAVSKQRAKEALEQLRSMIAPEFRGDAAEAHEALVTAVDESVDQAEELQDSVRPLEKRGKKVFAEWTENLEDFGNIAMRQRSQERLEETRGHHDAVIKACMSAQLAYDGFNGDLADHALFLEHDFNAASVAVVSQEFDGLKSRGKELARRLDAVALACEEFIRFSAPQSQLAPTASGGTGADSARRGG